MDSIISFLVFCQALGASVGAFTAVWSEIAYFRAMKDGQIDAAERAHIHVIANGLRWGMSLLLIASLGLVVAAYMSSAPIQPALTANYWTLIAIALIVVGVSFALSRRLVSFALGSAIVFTAWWFLAYLSFGWLPLSSFGAAAMSFIIATAVFYCVLRYSRFLYFQK